MSYLKVGDVVSVNVGELRREIIEELFSFRVGGYVDRAYYDQADYIWTDEHDEVDLRFYDIISIQCEPIQMRFPWWCCQNENEAIAIARELEYVTPPPIRLARLWAAGVRK